jgi:hypothetical protein
MKTMMLFMAVFAGMALTGGAPVEAAGIGSAFGAAQAKPAMLTPVRRIGRVARRAAPMVGRIARTAGKL